MIMKPRGLDGKEVLMVFFRFLVTLYVRDMR